MRTRNGALTVIPLFHSCEPSVQGEELYHVLYCLGNAIRVSRSRARSLCGDTASCAGFDAASRMRLKESGSAKALYRRLVDLLSDRDLRTVIYALRTLTALTINEALEKKAGGERADARATALPKPAQLFGSKENLSMIFHLVFHAAATTDDRAIVDSAAEMVEDLVSRFAPHLTSRA